MRADVGYTLAGCGFGAARLHVRASSPDSCRTVRAGRAGHSRRPPRSRYIPALDGIRTFAVLAVVLYHLGFTWAQGGFQGVTIFFVLSGYLITRLLRIEFARSRARSTSRGSGRAACAGSSRRP